jgi:hypothetical protein
MPTNPYAPPKARVADAQLENYGLKQRSVVVMILFTFITLGLYFMIWWFRRRDGLNRLNSPTKIALWPLLLFLALFVLQLGIGIAEGLNGGRSIGEGINLLASVFQLVVGIAMIVQAFRAKEIIEDHCAPEDRSEPLSFGEVKLSGVMTFFFSIFYLQWAINRYVLAPKL